MRTTVGVANPTILGFGGTPTSGNSEKTFLVLYRDKNSQVRARRSKVVNYRMSGAVT